MAHSHLPKLTPLRLNGGVWEAALSDLPDPSNPPSLVAHCGDTRLEAPEVQALEGGTWLLRLPIPADMISDGMQVFVVSTEDGREKLGSFALIAGDALADDLRAEVKLLRAELDMLKRAFRRHSREAN